VIIRSKRDAATRHYLEVLLGSGILLSWWQKVTDSQAVNKSRLFQGRDSGVISFNFILHTTYRTPRVFLNEEKAMPIFYSRSRTPNSKASISGTARSPKCIFPSNCFLYYLIYGDVFIGSPAIEAAAVVAKKRTSTSSSFCNFSKFGRILS
jgi:hypothetical protein